MTVTPQPILADVPLIEASSVSKRFRLERERQRSLQETFIRLWRRQRSEPEYFWPLRDFSFAIHAGDSVGILGQNGSGKSTLLKLLTGVLRPTSGSIRTNGRTASLLELGAGFHPDLTGRENIFLNASIYGMDTQTIRRNLDSIIDFAEIGEFIDTPVKHYSSGMYVRLGFAVAIHTQPEVLIVDEVLTVGDQLFQQKCMQRIWEMTESGVALILVSHNLEDVRRLCRRAIWLQSGIVRADGPSLEVVDEYLAYTNDLYYSRQRAEKQAEVNVPDPRSDEQRWGTFRAEITGVDLLDDAGQPQERFRQGTGMCVRIHYVTHERIIKPAFGLAIYRRDGVHVNGPNSINEGFVVDYIDGAGAIEYRIDQLPLNPGNFELTAAIYNRNGTIAIDHHHRMYHFAVLAQHKYAEEGIVHIPATWHHALDPEPSAQTVNPPLNSPEVR